MVLKFFTTVNEKVRLVSTVRVECNNWGRFDKMETKLVANWVLKIEVDCCLHCKQTPTMSHLQHTQYLDKEIIYRFDTRMYNYYNTI